MRATGDQLDEKFIIPIARELAIGLRAIHDAGVIHRDIKGRLSLSLSLQKLTSLHSREYSYPRRGPFRNM